MMLCCCCSRGPETTSRLRLYYIVYVLLNPGIKHLYLCNLPGTSLGTRSRSYRLLDSRRSSCIAIYSYATCKWSYIYTTAFAPGSASVYCTAVSKTGNRVNRVCCWSVFGGMATEGLGAKLKTFIREGYSQRGCCRVVIGETGRWKRFGRRRRRLTFRLCVCTRGHRLHCNSPMYVVSTHRPPPVPPLPPYRTLRPSKHSRKYYHTRYP